MQFSYSRVSTYHQCPRRFKYHYIDGLELIQDPEHDNALVVGNSLHLGIETDKEKMIKDYYHHYPIITDSQINEAIKLELLVDKVKTLLNGVNILHQEYEINVPEFKGIVDLIIDNQDGTIDVFDFKYSNNVDRYMESGQLHIYKYYLEQLGFKVNKLGFIFAPKTAIRQKKTENLYQFRKRIEDTLNSMNIQVVEVQYDYSKVIEFKNNCETILNSKDYPKNESKLCDWCDYQKYCMEGIDYMILPVNKRREITKVEKKVLWVYGAPFSGKTTFANDFPDPIMLNTDGNIKFVDAPYIPIKDKIEVIGRVTNKTFAWEILKETIDELEKKQNDFKTIVVDLLEDCYEHCRVYMYDKLKIEHESDNGFKAWDMVKTEFLGTLKRLMNLDYEHIILISHEDMSKDITKRTGDKITRIAPNFQEKAANKVAGMVDIVARAVANDGVHTLEFKKNEVIFGGGRLKVEANAIALDYKEFVKIYDSANAGKKKAKKEDKPKNEVVENVADTPTEASTPAVEDKPKRTRKRKTDAES